jgi:hypothetical protein
MISKHFRKIIISGAIIFIALLQFSCKPGYELGTTLAKPISDNKLYHRLVDNSLDYNTLYVKRFSANYSIDGLKKSFKGSMKIQKDSIIWIQMSAPIVGEVARVLITPDSVKFINRLKKEYFVGDFEYLNEALKIDLDFETIQSVLTNSVFEYCKEDNRSFIRNFKGKVVDNKYVFISSRASKINRKIKKDKTKKLNHINYQRFEIDPSIYRITDVFVRQFDEPRSLLIKYSDFKDFDEQKFPQQLQFDVRDAKHLLSCKIKFNKIIYDQKLKYSFRISSKFKKID